MCGRLLVFWVSASFVGLAGCGKSQTGPVNPQIDFSQKRKIFSAQEEDLNFPEGYPKELKLLAPTTIYEQDIFPNDVTWDTDVPVVEARDHYLAEFKKRGMETKVVIPPRMSGENYIVEVRDEETGRSFCVVLACEREGNSVKCFIVPHVDNIDEIKKSGE